MAQKKHLILIDDVDGSPASETLRFGLDGVDFEVDLNETHAEALRESFAEWIGHARKVSGRKKVAARRTVTSASTATSASSKTVKIREWARQNGYTVSDRGRIPVNVREAYEVAN
ncbi:histone-like nucleoid-structuring protein Lsr2 [Microbacterium lacusdiani]